MITMDHRYDLKVLLRLLTKFLKLKVEKLRLGKRFFFNVEFKQLHHLTNLIAANYLMPQQMLN